MTTLLQLQCTNTKQASLHYVPAEIQYDGKANVTSYFETTVETSSNKKSASLRGRPLQGIEFEVPKGYTGMILTETKKAITDQEERELTAVHSFKSFNYWNLDREPSEQDKLQQTVQWIEIAKSLHEPVDTGDSQYSLRSEPSM